MEHEDTVLIFCVDNKQKTKQTTNKTCVVIPQKPCGA